MIVTSRQCSMTLKIASIEMTLSPMISAGKGIQIIGGNINNVIKDFRGALTAMTSPADYKILEDQFQVKE